MRLGKRDTFSPPRYVSEVKHPQMKRKFEVVARKLKELQVATTWRDRTDQIAKPQCHFFMVAYDELVVQPPLRPDLDRIWNYKRREGGQFFFQVPEGFDQVKIGKKFEAMGKEMQNGKKTGTNWTIAKDIREFHQLLYGDSKFRTQGKNKQAIIRDTSKKRKRRNGKKTRNDTEKEVVNEIRVISSNRKNCNDIEEDDVVSV